MENKYDKGIHSESNVWITTEGERDKDLLQMLGLHETGYQSVVADCICWYVHSIKRGCGHVLRRDLEFVFGGQRKKRRLKRKWKKQDGEGSMNVGLSMEDALCESGLSVLVGFLLE